MTDRNYFYREAMLSYGEYERRGSQMFRGFWRGGNKVSHIYSTLRRVVIMAQAISQLRELASHTGNLGYVAQGAWGLEDLLFGRCHFLSDPCVFGYIF